jgi:predicted AAA+ superfamily ATPase
MKRATALAGVRELLRRSPVVAILGPRQAGKTTLALELARVFKRELGPMTRFDLEDPADALTLENPKLALEELTGLVVIDEVQRRPDLFPVLRVLVDRGPKRRRFLILGSASGDLMRQTSESLAGRIAFFELGPFALFEVPDAGRLWLRGGFPRAYLARSTAGAFGWLRDYVTTYLERDVPALGLRVPALRRFWTMLAHYHGQIVNFSELGRSLGVSDKTTRHYLDVLASTFMVRQLQPWYENVGKRQVKAPKVYFRDSGLLHVLLGIRAQPELLSHPKVGASWEGFALECVIRELGLRAEECFFWATHAHAELDLLTFVGGKRLGFEAKRADAPGVTKSMRVALEDLRLDHLLVVHPGAAAIRLDERVTAIGLAGLSTELKRWAG